MSTKKESPMPGKGQEPEINLNNPVDLIQEKIKELHSDRSFVELDRLMKQKVHHLLYNGGLFNNMQMKLLLANDDFPFQLATNGLEYDDFLLDMFCLELQFYCEKRMNAESFEYIFNTKNIANYERRAE